jgi:hypothetical protein
VSVALCQRGIGGSADKENQTLERLASFFIFFPARPTFCLADADAGHLV